MAIYPFGPFEPDRTDYAPDSTTVARNCLPVRDGWGPNPDIVAISQALPDECLGATYVRSSTGAFFIIAGTREGLYRLDTTDYSWEDISGPSAPYSVPQGDRWSFCQFGKNLVATNIDDPVQVYDIDTGVAFADLPGNPPQAKYAWNAGEFLVLGHLVSFPGRIQWSGIGNIGFWEVGLRGADFQDFPDGEDVIGGIGAERGAIVFQRRKIRQMLVTGNADYAFQIDVVNPERGVIAPLSIAQAGPNVFAYVSEAGFFMGVEGKPIGAERVDGWFFDNIDLDTLPDIRGVADPYRKLFWWQITKTDGTKFLLGYNWQLDRWCHADNNVSEMAVITTQGISIDGLDAFYDTIDDVTDPFDSRIFTGGRPVFGAFTTDNKLGFFTGTFMAATIETGTVELNPGSRSFLQEVRIVSDAPTYTVSVGKADRHGEAVTYGSAVTPFASTGKSHFRVPGALHRVRMNIPAGTAWGHVVAADVLSVREGQR
jgi:hypothetical protein